MIAGSPGPFNDTKTIEFAREVFSNFDLVTNREPLSIKILEKFGFDVKNVKSLACPAFLFEAGKREDIAVLIKKIESIKKHRPIAGFVICGWNFTNGPFDKWPRPDDDYINFAETVEFLTNGLGFEVCLMSHSNGFKVPPEEFELIHGRDFPIAQQLNNILKKRGIAKNFFLLDDILLPKETKTLIGSFDMFVSGRIHAAVAAISQGIPTVIIDYGHEPKAHKLQGFAKVAQMEDFVTDPKNVVNIKETIKICWENKSAIEGELKNKMKEIKHLARENFELLKGII